MQIQNQLTAQILKEKKEKKKAFNMTSNKNLNNVVQIFHYYMKRISRERQRKTCFIRL